ncbi:MAG: glycosyltransferase family 4 protein [Solirubrobacteraceae bacterium]
MGISATVTCGARDHARLLAQALAAENVSCSMHWLERAGGSLSASRTEIRDWARELAGELDLIKPDTVLFHYSTFAYSHRGVPLFVRPVLNALRGLRTPIVSVLHEFAYPWRPRDWRGNVWALTQRAALIDVMRASAAALVTTDSRAEWLASRPWLPRRPLAVAPVFSNLPPPAPGQRQERGGHLLGLFGYSYEGAASALVLDALALMVDQGQDVQLRLLGAPGQSSPAGETWRAQASARGVLPALSFSGILPAQELSEELAACEALLSVDTPGPSSRKGTLAASLASGRAVVALDGPQCWPELKRSDAARIVEPTTRALAGALTELLAEEEQREALGARGRALAEQMMSPRHSAEVVARLLGQVRGADAPAAQARVARR